MVNMLLVDSWTAAGGGGCSGGGAGMHDDGGGPKGRGCCWWLLMMMDVKKVFLPSLWSSRDCGGVVLRGGLELEARQI
jgi:hypothetical protein